MDTPQLPQMPLQPQPLPFQFNGGITPDGKVVFIFHTLMGTFQFFTDPDGAQKLSDGMAQLAQQARTGLQLPGAGLIVPDR